MRTSIERKKFHNQKCSWFTGLYTSILSPRIRVPAHNTCPTQRKKKGVQILSSGFAHQEKQSVELLLHGLVDSRKARAKILTL